MLGFAAVATGIGQAARGAQLLGAAEGLYEQLGVALPPFDRDNYGKTVSITRAALSLRTASPPRMLRDVHSRWSKCLRR